MKKIHYAITAFLATLGIIAAPLFVAGVASAQPAASSDGNASTKITQGLNQVGGQQNQTKLEDNIKTIVNIMLFILGAIAVIMIIIGGIRYTTSNGDASNTKSAKDTILYAVVGLVVAILAYAIVNFVVSQFGGRT